MSHAYSTPIVEKQNDTTNQFSLKPCLREKSSKKPSKFSHAYATPTVGKQNDGEKLIYLLTFTYNKSGEQDFSNEWFAIKQTSSRAEISWAFEHVPPHSPGGGLIHTSCIAVGSCLYIIGGEFSTDGRFSLGNYSNAVVYLDTHKPCEGWKHCFSFPFGCCRAKAGVCGHWMYVIYPPADSWGYVFNIDTREGYSLKQPGSAYFKAIYAVESGLLVYMPENTFYLHDPLRQTWMVYHEDKLSASRESHSRVISDGILYMYNCNLLHLYAYDVELRKHLPTIELPSSVGFPESSLVHMVSVANGKLCFIWGDRSSYPGCLRINYMKFCVCYNHAIPYVFVEDKQKFIIDGHRLINCVAIDPCRDGVQVNPKQLVQHDLFEHVEEKCKKETEPSQSLDAKGSIPVAVESTKKSCNVVGTFVEESSDTGKSVIDAGNLVVVSMSDFMLKPIGERLNISILQVRDKDAADNQYNMWRILGKELAVEVLHIDSWSSDTLVVLEEVHGDIRSWFKELYRVYMELHGYSDDWSWWWDHIKEGLRKLLRGVLNSIQKMYPNHWHGNWIDGIAVINGEAKLYNFKARGVQSASSDLESLCQMLDGIIACQTIESFGLENKGLKSMEWYKGYNVSEEFANFMRRIKGYAAGKNVKEYLDAPYFWDHEKRNHFVEKMYYFLWGEQNLMMLALFNKSFSKSWSWKDHIPEDGVYRRIFSYAVKDACEGQKSVAYNNAQRDSNGRISNKFTREVDMIAFFKACKEQYNDHSGGVFKTEREIGEELNETFGICWRSFEAACVFVNESFTATKVLKLQRKFAERFHMII